MRHTKRDLEKFTLELRGNTMTPLNKDQVAMYKTRMINGGSPVRFMHNGCAVSITTGEHDPKGTNVMHQRMYWCFDKETALEIAAITGTRAQF